MVEILRRAPDRLFLLQWRKTPPDWDGAGEIFKLGPKEWLIRRNEPHPALIEITEGLACFVLSGPDARDLLAKTISLDLHRRAFAPGDWARTLFAQIPVILHHEAPGFVLYVDISYERYIAQWLKEGLRDIA